MGGTGGTSAAVRLCKHRARHVSRRFRVESRWCGRLKLVLCDFPTSRYECEAVPHSVKYLRRDQEDLQHDTYIKLQLQAFAVFTLKHGKDRWQQQYNKTIHISGNISRLEPHKYLEHTFRLVPFRQKFPRGNRSEQRIEDDSSLS